MIKKEHLLVLILGITMAVVFVSCSADDDEEPDEWVKAPDFEGLPRSGAAVFTIGDYAYVTTGYGTNSNRFQDTWRYHAVNGTWDKMADFPGEARNNAVSFVVDGKGYVGLGANSTTMFSDFYVYDPAADKWEAIPEFPGTARWGAVAFSLNNIGYVGTGRDKDVQDYNDFYSYSPSGNVWSKSTSTPVKRSFAFAFVLNNNAYLGGGVNNNANVASFFAFDGNTWTEKNLLSGRDDDYTYNLTRLSPAAFVLSGHAYICGGLSGVSGTVIGSTWRYVPSGDYWEEHHPFGSSSGAANRQQAAAFVLDGKAYISTGRSGTVPFDDTWQFTPNPW